MRWRLVKCETVKMLVFYNGYLSTFGNGNGDLVPVNRHDIEYDGIFSVEELKLFEIKFVFHVVPPQSTNLYQTEYSTSISRVS